MKIGFAALIFLCLFQTHYSFSQTDSTDLTLTMSDPVLETAEDSVFYPEEFFGELSLEFDLTDTADFGKLHVELKLVGHHSILYHKSFTEAQLNSLGLLSGDSVAISFGNREKDLSYYATIVIESTEGTLNKSIHKTLNP